MKAQQVDHYNKISLNQILEEYIQHPQRKHLFMIIYSKARTQSCDPRSLEMVLKLLQNDKKWLIVIQRFAQLELKLTFSYCAKNITTYITLINVVYQRDEPEYHAYLEKIIQQHIDNISQQNLITLNQQIWDTYIEYLSRWFQSLPHRTLYALQNIQRRLSQKQNIYELINQSQRIKFIKQLADILHYNENGFSRKMQLRRFWESIPATITFLRFKLTTEEGLLAILAMRLQTIAQMKSRSMQINCFSQEKHYLMTEQQKKQLQLQLQTIMSFLTSTSQVSILQQIYLQSSSTLCKRLLRVKIINYTQYQTKNIEQVMQLESSLIYHVRSDDFPSLFQQLLTTLVERIPNFLPIYFQHCAQALMMSSLDEADVSDIVLKLCIVSKHLVQYNKVLPEVLNVKLLIQKLTIISQTKSQLIQIKILKLMHYFKELLPQSNYIRYHEIIFTLIKSTLIKKISSNQFTQTENSSQSICFSECVKILQQQTQKPQQEKLQMKIRKKKFTNQRYTIDLFQKNELWMSDKLMDLLSLQGYCAEQIQIFKIFKNMMQKYSSIQARNTVSFIKLFSRNYLFEYERIRLLRERDRVYNKIFYILECIQIIIQSINEDIYFQCQQFLVPVIQTLKHQPMAINILEEHLVVIIEKLIYRAKMITPELCNFIIYSKQVLVGNKSSLLQIQKIIMAMCKPKIVESVKNDWCDLVKFFTMLFLDYFDFLANDQDYLKHYIKQHKQIFHLIQLFLQSYEEVYWDYFELAQTLIQIQYIVEKINFPEPVLQMVMTIHHIVSKCKLYPLPALFDLNFYTERYSLQMIQLTLVDILIKNIRNRIFDFENSNNQVYPFLQQFSHLREQISQRYFNFQSTLNDTLPFSKINIQNYISSALTILRRDKLIDAQSQHQLNNKLFDDRYLIKQSMFQ